MTASTNPTEQLDDCDRQLMTMLVDAAEPRAERMETLRLRLASEAAEAGVLDVAYTTITTPVGALLLAATAQGLLRVAYERENFDAVLASLATRISPRLLRAPERLATVHEQIDEYFAGDRTEFDLPLDYSLSAGFRQQVQRHLSLIPYGRTESYKDVARIVGNPNAVRAVGTACATNPLPVVVPCHRVLRTDGGLGGYIGGLDAKTILLDLERAA
ncbi:MAG: O-6-methylguanine methyltransferase [Glaciihabitans sp.]|nr:O-6-methylguanine methyltransferase [Glaciihabitans sp.]